VNDAIPECRALLSPASPGADGLRVGASEGGGDAVVRDEYPHVAFTFPIRRPPSPDQHCLLEGLLCSPQPVTTLRHQVMHAVGLLTARIPSTVTLGRPVSGVKGGESSSLLPPSTASAAPTGATCSQPPLHLAAARGDCSCCLPPPLITTLTNSRWSGCGAEPLLLLPPRCGGDAGGRGSTRVAAELPAVPGR
jgi:hypothetical protein